MSDEARAPIMPGLTCQKAGCPRRESVDGVERAKNVLVVLQSQGAQEDCRQEFALAVNADIEQVFRVVFEFDPRPAVGNQLRQEICVVLSLLEEDSRRSVERDDDAFGAVDDEGAVFGHQRQVAEIDLFFFDVANRFLTRLLVLVPDGQADFDVQRHGVGHPALLALLHVIFVLQADRLAAVVAGVDDVAVVSPLFADHVFGRERVDFDHRAALAAVGAQVMQSLQLAAFALPVADAILDEFQRRRVAEVGDRKG